MKIPILLLALLTFSMVNAHRHVDYYKVLNVSRDADTKKIKRAGRKLSAKYHPDRNDGDESAKEKYHQV